MQPPTCYNLNMSIFISVIILIMLSLIQFLMQLSSGIFMLFYHYALGKKSAKIADNLSLYFILGVEFFTAAVWFTVFLILPDASPILFWILAGILFAESLASLFFYYRKAPLPLSSFPVPSPKILKYMPKISKLILMLSFLAFLPISPN